MLVPLCQNHRSARIPHLGQHSFPLRDGCRAGNGARYVFASDKTAVWVDARSTEEFAVGSLTGAVNMIDKDDVTKAKDDKRLPMQDHNTRIIVFGADGEQASAIATEIAKNAFHNVSFFGGTFKELMEGIQQ